MAVGVLRRALAAATVAMACGQAMGGGDGARVGRYSRAAIEALSPSTPFVVAFVDGDAATRAAAAALLQQASALTHGSLVSGAVELMVGDGPMAPAAMHGEWAARGVVLVGAGRALLAMDTRVNGVYVFAGGNVSSADLPRRLGRWLQLSSVVGNPRDVAAWESGVAVAEAADGVDPPAPALIFFTAFTNPYVARVRPSVEGAATILRAGERGVPVGEVRCGGRGSSAASRQWCREHLSGNGSETTALPPLPALQLFTVSAAADRDARAPTRARVHGGFRLSRLRRAPRCRARSGCRYRGKQRRCGRITPTAATRRRAPLRRCGRRRPPAAPSPCGTHRRRPT